MPPIAMCNVKLDNTDQIFQISLQDINSCAETAKTFLKRKFKVQEEPSILYHGKLSNRFFSFFGAGSSFYANSDYVHT